MNFGSTQNRNSKAEYECEKQENKKVLDYYTFNSYGKNDNPFFFSIGSVPKSSREHLSLNSVDTESYLRNISSTNLEENRKELKPVDISKYRKSGLLYDINNVQMPEDMRILKNQRPGPTK